jgi:hypothetical protein
MPRVAADMNLVEFGPVSRDCGGLLQEVRLDEGVWLLGNTWKRL